MNDDHAPRHDTPSGIIEKPTGKGGQPAPVVPTEGNQLPAQVAANIKLRAGLSRAEVTTALTNDGVPSAEASQATEAAYAELLADYTAQHATPNVLVRAIVGAVVAAIIAGVLWGMLEWKTRYEIGFAAIGVALLVGFVVHRIAGRRRGRELQIIAAAGAVLGILLGKYFAIWFVARATGVDVSIIDSRVIDVMRDPKAKVFGIADLFFFAIGISYAWRALAAPHSNFKP